MVNVNQQAYVQDITMVQINDKVEGDPEIGYLQTGLVFELRGTCARDRSAMSMDLTFTQSDLEAMDKKQTAYGCVEMPRVSLQRICSGWSQAPGSTVLLVGPGKKGETLLLLMKSQVMEEQVEAGGR